MNRKRSVIFIPATIRSHYIPSFYLAKVLSQFFDIYYIGNADDFGELVVSQGFHFVDCGSLRFGIGFERYHQGEVPALSFFDRVKEKFSNRIFSRRKEDLHRVVQELKPKAVFIDIFSSTDFLVLYPFRHAVKILFFNPMLSTFRISGYPYINESTWPRNENSKTGAIQFFKERWARYGFQSSLQLLKVYISTGAYRTHKLFLDNPATYAFRNVPEIILAPVELEFSRTIRRRNQYYLGLCVNDDRYETNADNEYENAIDTILRKNRLQEKKIVYCSFGTYFYYLEEHKAIVSFLLALIEAFQHESGVCIVISANENIQDALHQLTSIPAHFYLFKKVRQLEVLRNADAFITHGGLGSVKEAIYFEVPMVVYPLDMAWDQNGNAMKVVHHGIGLRGDILKDEPETIYEKIMAVLHRNLYKEKLAELNRKIKTVYDEQYLNDVLSRLLDLRSKNLDVMEAVDTPVSLEDVS